jgi:hypothetical protein
VATINDRDRHLPARQDHNPYPELQQLRVSQPQAQDPRQRLRTFAREILVLQSKAMTLDQVREVLALDLTPSGVPTS